MRPASDGGQPRSASSISAHQPSPRCRALVLVYGHRDRILACRPADSSARGSASRSPRPSWPTAPASAGSSRAASRPAATPRPLTPRCASPASSENRSRPSATLPHPRGPSSASRSREGDTVVVGRVGDRLPPPPSPASRRRRVVGDARRDRRARRRPDAAGRPDDGLVVVGCDPVLGLCESLLSRGGGRGLVAVSGTTGAPIAALADGRAHAALVHGPDGRLPEPPVPARRIHLARWQVGIGLGARRGVGSLEELLTGRMRLIQREESAASQQALARAAGELIPRATVRARRPRRRGPPGRDRRLRGGHLRARGAPSRPRLPAARDPRRRALDRRAVARPSRRPVARGPARLERVPGASDGPIGGYDLEGCGSLVGTA